MADAPPVLQPDFTAEEEGGEKPAREVMYESNSINLKPKNDAC